MGSQSAEGGAKMMAVGAATPMEVGGATLTGKLTEAIATKRTPAYPDQRLEISLLALFSYDRFSIVLPEKGWL